MSQIYKRVTSGALPADVATTYNADNGSATPAANILIISANDTTEDNPNGIQTDAGAGEGLAANEVQVQLTNRLQGTGTSTNASNADLITFALDAANPKGYRFFVQVAGRSTAGAFTGEVVGYTIMGSAKTDGAAASAVSSAFRDNDEDTNLAGATMSVVASGNNIIFRAVGIAGETINYSAVGEYVVV